MVRQRQRPRKDGREWDDEEQVCEVHVCDESCVCCEEFLWVAEKAMPRLRVGETSCGKMGCWAILYVAAGYSGGKRLPIYAFASRFVAWGSIETACGRRVCSVRCDCVEVNVVEAGFGVSEVFDPFFFLVVLGRLSPFVYSRRINCTNYAIQPVRDDATASFTYVV